MCCLKKMKRFKAFLLRLPLVLIPSYFTGRILRGYRVYRAIRRKYGMTAEWYSAFSTSSGDVYFAASLHRAAVQRDGTGAATKFLVMGNGERSLADWFGISETIVTTEQESHNLLRMYRFLHADPALNIHILHCQPAQMYYGIPERILSFRGFDFLTMTLIACGNFSREQLKFPPRQQAEEELCNIFSKHGLVAGKTVLLAPYAQCIEELPLYFWEKIAEKLRDLGYFVCTNCGNPQESPICGTVGLSVPYRLLTPFLEQAGYLIALRSGLVDISCFANCKRIILYPKENFNVWGIGTPKDCFSLRAMGLRDDAVEMEYEKESREQLCERLMQVIQEWESFKELWEN